MLVRNGHLTCVLVLAMEMLAQRKLHCQVQVGGSLLRVFRPEGVCKREFPPALYSLSGCHVLTTRWPHWLMSCSVCHPDTEKGTLCMAACPQCCGPLLDGGPVPCCLGPLSRVHMQTDNPAKRQRPTLCGQAGGVTVMLPQACNNTVRGVCADHDCPGPPPWHGSGWGQAPFGGQQAAPQQTSPQQGLQRPHPMQTMPQQGVQRVRPVRWLRPRTLAGPHGEAGACSQMGACSWTAGGWPGRGDAGTAAANAAGAASCGPAGTSSHDM